MTDNTPNETTKTKVIQPEELDAISEIHDPETPVDEKEYEEWNPDEWGEPTIMIFHLQSGQEVVGETWAGKRLIVRNAREIIREYEDDGHDNLTVHTTLFPFMAHTKKKVVEMNPSMTTCAGEADPKFASDYLDSIRSINRPTEAEIISFSETTP